PPKAPVLYIKTANTFTADGTDIPVPARVPQVEVGATIAMVMNAPGEVGAYGLMNDLSVPHAGQVQVPGRISRHRRQAGHRTRSRRSVAIPARSAHQRGAEADRPLREHGARCT